MLILRVLVPPRKVRDPSLLGGPCTVWAEGALEVWQSGSRLPGGVGFGPWAPGTWGALLSVILFSVFLADLGPVLYAVMLVVLTLVGIWSSGAAERYFGKSDDGRIVIDEVVGQFVALSPLLLIHNVPLGRISLPGSQSVLASGIELWWILVVTAFVAFRWFDIRKPGPVQWAEQRFKGGVGVMADDLVAGALGAAVVIVPAYVLAADKLRELVRDSMLAWLQLDRLFGGYWV